MTNPILETHKSGTSNTILVSHSWPPGNSNSILASHAGDYPGGGGGSFAITSVSLSGTELTINGAQFGTKAGPAPYFFRSWVGASAGLTWQQAGYTQYRTDKWEGAARTVTGEGIGGASAMKITCRQADPDTDADAVFTHPQLFMPASTQGLFFSQWMRFDCLGTVNNRPQIKGPRSGPFSGTPSDEGGNYATNPHMSASLFTNFNWDTSDDSDVQAEYSSPISGDGEEHSYAQGNPPPVGFGENAYFNWEGRYVFNDVGVANGIMEHYINGKIQAPKYDCQNRASSGQYLDFFSPHPGFENMSAANDRDWDIYFSRPYVDTGPDMLARVFLGNSATLGSCTGRFLCPPTVWGSTQIKVSDVENVPTGYDWVYVVKSDGTISNGYQWR